MSMYLPQPSWRERQTPRPNSVVIAWEVAVYDYDPDRGMGMMWLRSPAKTGQNIHGSMVFLSREEAESAVLLDAATHPHRIGKYRIRPLYSEYCRNPAPCFECRKFLGVERT